MKHLIFLFALVFISINSFATETAKSDRKPSSVATYNSNTRTLIFNSKNVSYSLSCEDTKMLTNLGDFMGQDNTEVINVINDSNGIRISMKTSGKSAEARIQTGAGCMLSYVEN